MLYFEKDLITFDSFTFSGGERHVQLQHIPDKKPRDLKLIVDFKESSDIIDLLLIDNAIKHEYGEKAYNLFIPYLPYARQDRICSRGQAFSLEVFASLLNSLSVSYITTIDVHSDVSKELIPNLINLKQENYILSNESIMEKIMEKNTVLICPDAGAKNRVEGFRDAFPFFKKEIVYCDKKRNSSTGNLSGFKVHSQNLSGKTCVILDDICDGGGTFLGISTELIKLGADRIILIVSHGIFSKGLDIFKHNIDEVYSICTTSDDVFLVKNSF